MSDVKWYGSGEPEQFADIEVKLDDGRWVEATFLCRHDGAAIVAVERPDDGFNYLWRYWAHVRPIRNAEDEAVDEMIRRAGLDDEQYNRVVCHDLYRAGYRKEGTP